MSWKNLTPKQRVTRRLALGMLLSLAALTGDVLLARQAEARLHGGVAGSVTPPPMGSITTLTISNSGGSSESPLWSKMFGLYFPDSDITGCPLVGGLATYPEFKSGSNVLGYSMSVYPTYYPSGRLQWAAFVIGFNGLVAVSAGGTASIAVNQTNNTNLPSASSRNLSDVAGADLKQVLTVMDGPGSGTTYTSSLNTGASNAFSDNYVWLDGPAGKCLRTRQPFMNGVTAHGALQGYHYTMLYQTAGGSFGGCSHLVSISNPAGDITQTLRDWYSFSAMTFQSGATVIRDNVTSGRTNSWSITWGGIGQPTSFNTSGNNTIESFTLFRLTTTGTLPPEVSTGVSYFAWTGDYYHPPFTSVVVLSDIDKGAYINMSNGGAGTHTLTQYPYMTGYTRLYSAGTTGEWDYLQAGGSRAPLSGTTMTNCQVQFDRTYMRSTMAVPSYDFSPSVTPGSQTPFYINTACGFNNNPGDGGVDEHIGIMPTPFVRHLYTQSLTDERNVRAIGLSAGLVSGGNLRLSASNFQIPCTNNGHNGSGATYSGMPAPNPNIRFGGSYATSNSYQPNSFRGYQSLLGQSVGESSHRTQNLYYPALITGEPQFLDQLIEQGNSAVYTGYVGGSPSVSRISTSVFAPYGTTPLDGNNAGNRNVTTNGVTRYGIHYLTSSNREDAWYGAMIGCAAALCPNGGPWGGIKQYFTDVVQDNIDFVNAIIALLPPYAATIGLYQPQAGIYLLDTWQNSYCVQTWSMIHGFKVANCLGPMNTTLKFFSYIINTFGIWPMSLEEFNVRWLNGVPSPPSDGSQPLVDADSKMGFLSGALASWTNGSATFTLDMLFPDWVPAIGETITFTAPDPSAQLTTPIPGAFNWFQQYYIVSSGGAGLTRTITLSATPGGSAIVNTDSSAHSILIWNQPLAPINTLQGNNVNDYPTVNMRTSLLAISRGATMDATAKNALLSAVPAANNAGFGVDPKYCFGQVA